MGAQPQHTVTYASDYDIRRDVPALSTATSRHTSTYARTYLLLSRLLVDQRVPAVITATSSMTTSATETTRDRQMMSCVVLLLVALITAGSGWRRQMS